MNEPCDFFQDGCNKPCCKSSPPNPANVELPWQHTGIWPYMHFPGSNPESLVKMASNTVNTSELLMLKGNCHLQTIQKIIPKKCGWKPPKTCLGQLLQHALSSMWLVLFGPPKWQLLYEIFVEYLLSLRYVLYIYISYMYMLIICCIDLHCIYIKYIQWDM